MEKLLQELQKTVEDFNNLNQVKGSTLLILFGIELQLKFCAK